MRNVQRLTIIVTALLRLCVSVTMSNDVAAVGGVSDAATAVNATNSGNAMAVAEKLVRFRRQPLSIIKHVSRATHKHRHRKPHRRYKRPKISYVRPRYSYSAPHQSASATTYYKSHRKKPKFTVEDIKHLSIDADEFEPPSTSYESQVMDLDFYSHDDLGGDEGDELADKYHSFEAIEPTYTSYKGSEITKHHSSSVGDDSGGYVVRAPHKAYGVPTNYEYASDFPSSPPDEHNGYTYNRGHSYESSSYETSKHDYEHRPDAPPPHQSPPTTAYGVSASDHDAYATHPAQQPQHPPPSSPSQRPSPGDPYAMKIPNSGYDLKHDFAEPPPPRPQPALYDHRGGEHGGSIEISYSPPAYEINLPPTQSGDEHPLLESGSGDESGHFAEPPAPTAPAQEVPTYHAPAPAPAPPPLPPQKHPASIQDYLPPKQELPLNPHHKQPAYDYPKSSYEVPIYDPIPFDASSVDHRELYPPHPYDILRQPPDGHNDVHYDSHETEAAAPHDITQDDRHAAGTSHNAATEKPTKRKRRQRKRKRVQAATTVAASSTKHILDTPELDAAFHADTHQRAQLNDNDADGHESSFVVNKQTTSRSPTMLPYPNHSDYTSHAWNPMRLRTPTPISIPLATASTTTRPTTLSQHTPVGATATGMATAVNRKRPYQRPSARPVRVQSDEQVKPQNTRGVTLVTIEKSRSQDFYDGTTTPPITSNGSNAQRTRPTRVRMPTRQPHVATSNMSPIDKTRTTATTTTNNGKRTTKSVFETTYFKTPRSYLELQQKLSAYEFHLPKNHRPY